MNALSPRRAADRCLTLGSALLSKPSAYHSLLSAHARRESWRQTDRHKEHARHCATRCTVMQQPSNHRAAIVRCTGTRFPAGWSLQPAPPPVSQQGLTCTTGTGARPGSCLECTEFDASKKKKPPSQHQARVFTRLAQR